MSARPYATSARFLVAGGGTGGHVTPALALAEELVAHGEEVLILGSERGLETGLVPAAGFALVALPSQQFVGRSLAQRARASLALVRTTAAAWRVLRRFRPDLVISVGGYAAAPAVLAAALSRTPLAILEPNAIPGRVNRLAARLARRVFLGLEAAGACLSVRRERLRAFGVPLRRALRESFGAGTPRRRPAPPFRLLVFGGSQGARQLNRAMQEALAHLQGLPLDVFHQTGAAERDAVAESYAAAGVAARVVAFEPDMPARYRWADLAVCRAGALSVAELALAGLPAILVPLASAADDHQNENAKALEAAGAARRLDPRTLGAKELADAIAALCADPDGLVAMGRRAAALARPDAAARIAAGCRELARPGRGE
jgi:UDP-N-acetylglucosamine--N-acetylmuramyl-(pentapeptide) pyrophosphoryl-undecaprenol N-acetylglucosamine transferase